MHPLVALENSNAVETRTRVFVFGGTFFFDSQSKQGRK